MQNTAESIELSGQIERITFSSEDNGFTVARVAIPGQKDPVVVVGNIAQPTPGQCLKMKGEWINDKKYGKQFKLIFCKTELPAKAAGIEKFLGSGMIKGIGPVMAKRIVSAFGDETLEVIDKHIERLFDIAGIGDKRVEVIKKGWDENRGIEEVMTFLMGKGISSGPAFRIYKQYGNRSIDVMTENPYRLAWDIDGVGFLTADRLAEKMGFSKEAPERAEAGILYALNEMASLGHVYAPRDELVKNTCELLKVDNHGLILGAITRVAIARDNELPKIVIEDFEDGSQAVYQGAFHVAEKRSAYLLKSILKAPRRIRSNIDVEKALAWAQEKANITLSEGQKEAVRLAIDNKVAIITGGPGTGKSTILAVILKIYGALHANMLLAAPTGRAAKRMNETTGLEAKTIHRLLESKRGGFGRNDKNPLECDLLVIDEASMIDNMLLYNLLKAIPPQAGVLFIGDINQLPSVGPGAVLRDMINSSTIPVAELKEIFRQAAESQIVTTAHRINQGLAPVKGETQKDFFFFFQEEPQQIVDQIVDLIKNRLPQCGYDPIQDIQVLCPMHKGIVGGSNLNEVLQQTLNPNGQELTKGGRKFRVGDKVMQIRNNYDKEVYNGDWGILTKVDPETQDVTVMIEDREVVYDFKELDELVTAYAISVHKSQGSEYPCVIIPVHTQHYMLLQRNLLYTGITRGKKLVITIGTNKAMNIAVKNNKTQKRYTRLEERLR